MGKGGTSLTRPLRRHPFPSTEGEEEARSRQGLRSPLEERGPEGRGEGQDQAISKRSAFITLTQAATKSFANRAPASAVA